MRLARATDGHASVNWSALVVASREPSATFQRRPCAGADLVARRSISEWFGACCKPDGATNSTAICGGSALAGRHSHHGE